MKDQPVRAAASPKAGVILCSCGGTLFGEAQGKRIAAAVRNGGPPVLLSAHACAAAEGTALAAALRRQGVAKAVFAGCSLRERQDLAEGLTRRAGLTPSALKGVNLRDPAFRGLSSREAVRQAISSIQGALRALSLQPAFEMRRIPLAPEVLVIGDGPVGREAARAAQALGHPTTLIGDRAAGAEPAGGEHRLAGSVLLGLEGQVGAFSARVGTPSGVQTLRAGAVIVSDGAPAEAEDSPGPILPLARLSAAAALPRTGGVRSVGILLDLEIDESRASTEAALTLALALQDRDRVQVYLFCRDVRVAALPLEALYDRAREAGVAIVKFSGVPRVQPGGKGVSLTLQDAVLAQAVSLHCDLLGVSPGGLAARAAVYRALAALTGVSTDGLGRLQDNNVHLLPEKTNRPGIFAIGACRGEDYLPQGIREARGAALAAHELLAPGSLEVELSHPVVDADKCALCLTCVRSCPFQAMRVNAGKGAAESLPEVCQRCGTCAGECPAKAIELPVYSDRILLTLLA